MAEKMESEMDDLLVVDWVRRRVDKMVVSRVVR